jgi:DNA-nicking Smr family endonuclease
MGRKNKTPVDGPFRGLSDIIHKAGMQLKTQDAPAVLNPPKVKASALQKSRSEGADEDAFLTAMDGVDPASWKHQPHPSSPPAPKPPIASDSDDQRLMKEALENDKPVPILDHPEYIEGWIGVAGKRFLPLLRNGLYSIQGQIDLHGYNRVEAQIVVEDYITKMARSRSCCIKIIHGRGINSPTDKATLKENLQRLLSTRRMARYVVAYASAPVCDGGVGAVYVLLRRQ